LIAAADDRDALRRKGEKAHELATSAFSRSKLSKDWVNWVTGAARR